MCARYTREIDADGVGSVFDVANALSVEPDSLPTALFGKTWNAAPGTNQVIVAQAPGQEARQRAARWGLAASWAPRTLINARAESVHLKEVFRRSFEAFRCIVPATGFYEWESRTRTRIPHFFVVGTREPFAMAGLWAPATGAEPARFCILTTEPNETVAPVHDRMPVILHRSDVARWLAPTSAPGQVRQLLAPFSGKMRSWKVSKKVNATRFDAPDLVTPWADPQLSLL